MSVNLLFEDNKVKAMASMTGFWLSDGYRSDPHFALESEDHDGNDYVERDEKL